MKWSVEVTNVEEVTDESDNTFAVYNVYCTFNEKEWNFGWRFSEFVSFRDDLKNSDIGSKYKIPSLPSRAIFKKHDDEFLENRRIGLDKFLTELFSSFPQDLFETVAQKFFEKYVLEIDPTLNPYTENIKALLTSEIYAPAFDKNQKDVKNEKITQLISEILCHDDELRDLHTQLVPDVITYKVFWTKYFYGIEITKEIQFINQELKEKHLKFLEETKEKEQEENQNIKEEKENTNNEKEDKNIDQNKSIDKIDSKENIETIEQDQPQKKTEKISAAELYKEKIVNESELKKSKKNKKEKYKKESKEDEEIDSDTGFSNEFDVVVMSGNIPQNFKYSSRILTYDTKQKAWKNNSVKLKLPIQQIVY